MQKILLQRMLITLTLLLGAISAASAANRLYIDSFYIEPGQTKTLALNLDNGELFYGFQADIALPEGLTFCVVNGSPSIALASRTDASYAVVTNLVNLQSVRVGAFSSTHSPIAGSTGALLLVAVTADDEFAGGEMTLSNIHFVGNNDQDIVLPNFTLNIRNRADNRCYLEDFSIAVNQTKTVSLLLDNETPFTAFQTDVYLPDGFSIVAGSVKSTVRANNHSISAKSFSDGRTRIICFSPDNSVITPGRGALLEFDIHLNKDTEDICAIELKNQTFSTLTADEYVLPNSSTAVTVSGVFVTEISIDNSRVEMNIGETLVLNATVNPSHATNKDIEWTSSNTEVATVSSTGVVSAVEEGDAIITARSIDGSNVSASCVVTVKRVPVESVSITASGSTTLKVGQTVQLSATVLPEAATDKSIVWSSSDMAVATVDNAGLVTAIKPGTCEITASTTDGSNLSAQCAIEVVQPVTSIALSAHELLLRPNETFSLVVTIEPMDATDKSVKWDSSNEDIAEVDNFGVITVNQDDQEGETIISVSTLDGSNLTDECLVAVKKDYSGTRIISMDDIDITVNNNQVIVSELKNGVEVRLFAMDGVLLNSAVGNGTDIIFDIAPNTHCILNIGSITLKLISK